MGEPCCDGGRPSSHPSPCPQLSQAPSPGPSSANSLPEPPHTGNRVLPTPSPPPRSPDHTLMRGKAEQIPHLPALSSPHGRTPATLLPLQHLTMSPPNLQGEAGVHPQGEHLSTVLGSTGSIPQGKSQEGGLRRQGSSWIPLEAILEQKGGPGGSKMPEWSQGVCWQVPRPLLSCETRTAVTGDTTSLCCRCNFSVTLAAPHLASHPCLKHSIGLPPGFDLPNTWTF